VSSVLNLVPPTEDTETELSLDSTTHAGPNSRPYIGLAGSLPFGSRSAKELQHLSFFAQTREGDYLSHTKLFL
jgi:hypothetical protein